jgi:enamine deaminase RidA (YjgF/YER057c/UK114 family)
MREHINPPTLPQPPGYTQVVKTSGGTTVYVAGQVAWDANGGLVGDADFEAQTRQVFSNLMAALDAVGARPEHLVKVGIYIVGHDPDKLAVVRRVRDEAFGDITPPASTLLGVESLAVPGLMIEADAIAVLD